MSEPTPVVASRAARVTLFEDRAEVDRAASVPVDQGTTWVRVEGLTPYVDDRSLQVRVTGGAATVVTARVLRLVRQEPVAGREEVEARQREAEEARQKAVTIRRVSERAGTAALRLTGLVPDWAEAVGRIPAQVPDAARSWGEAYEALDRAGRQATVESWSTYLEWVKADAAATRAEQRLAEARVVRPRVESYVEVLVEAVVSGVVDLALTYRTPMALWRPEHVARLDDNTVEWVTLATAWQRTGEVWDGVEVRFSTARPARAASPPLLADDILESRRRTDEERKTIEIEARDQVISMAGLDHGARAVEEMPGVDDGGEPQVYKASAPVTLISDGRPFRVEVDRFVLPAEVERVAYPEMALVAHHRATLTLRHGRPLLAGPVRVARGASLVGRGPLDFVAPGEPFEVGFGPDDAVRVRRLVATESDSGIAGSQKSTRSVKVFLSNLSGEAKSVIVSERVPVSEIDEVKVSLTEDAGWEVDKDGLARRRVDLPAHGTEVLELGYELRARGNVRMTLP